MKTPGPLQVLAVVVGLATGAEVGLRASGRSGSAVIAPNDLATRQSADHLLHFLAEDGKDRKGAAVVEVEGKNSTAKNATLVKKKEVAPDSKSFMDACLVHTAEMIDKVDQSYTDVQLKTVLENECHLAKEFPLTYTTNFDDHQACMDFASFLADARREELDSANHTNTKGYTEFCAKFYQDKYGQAVAVEGAKPEVVDAWVWSSRMTVLLLVLAIFVIIVISCICMRKKRSN